MIFWPLRSNFIHVMRRLLNIHRNNFERFYFWIKTALKTNKITQKKLRWESWFFNIFNLKPFADASPEVILMQTDWYSNIFPPVWTVIYKFFKRVRKNYFLFVIPKYHWKITPLFGEFVTLIYYFSEPLTIFY